MSGYADYYVNPNRGPLYVDLTGIRVYSPFELLEAAKKKRAEAINSMPEPRENKSQVLASFLKDQEQFSEYFQKVYGAPNSIEYEEYEQIKSMYGRIKNIIDAAIILYRQTIGIIQAIREYKILPPNGATLGNDGRLAEDMQLITDESIKAIDQLKALIKSLEQYIKSLEQHMLITDESENSISQLEEPTKSLEQYMKQCHFGNNFF